MPEKITFELTTNELEGLIHGLEKVWGKLNEDNQIEITIDFKSGEMFTKVLPTAGDEFTIEF